MHSGHQFTTDLKELKNWLIMLFHAGRSLKFWYKNWYRFIILILQFKKASPLCSDEMFHARYDYRIQICFFYPCTKSGGYLCGESWFPSTEEVFQLLKDVCHCEQKNLHIRQVNSGSFLIQVCSPAEQKIESRASHISSGRVQISLKLWNVHKDPSLSNRRHNM